MEKVYSITVFYLILISLVASCKERYEEVNNLSSTSIYNMGEDEITIDNTGTKCFNFNDFNTHMVIPKVWTEGIFIKQGSTNNCPITSTEYTVTFIGKEKHEKQYLGSIYIFSRVSWEFLMNSDHNNEYAKLNEVNGNVYAYKPGHINPYIGDHSSKEDYTLHYISILAAQDLIQIKK